MKFALLGAEPDVVPLLTAIQASPEHDLVAAYDANLVGVDLETETEFERNLGTAITDDGWESLMLGSVADAVIVCRDSEHPEERAEQLRKLAQEAVPLVVVHPIGEAVLAFELLMIRQDSGGLIVPYQPEVDHSVMTGLFGTGATMEPVQQLSVERRLVDQSSNSVRQQFARDAMYIRQLMGQIDQINALAAAQDRADYSGLSVQMSDQHSSVARWALLPANEDGSKWTVHRESGAIVVETQADPTAWQIDTGVPAQQSSVEAASHFVERFVDDLQKHEAGQATSRPDWEDACRSIELLENIDISRRRKKTVSLYYEDISEENTFKSLMAAGGCLMLLLVTLLLPAVAAIESIIHSASDYSATDYSATGSGDNDATLSEQSEDVSTGEFQPSGDSPFLRSVGRSRRDLGWIGKWPVILFLVLAVFIGLQFLRFATKSNASDSRQRPPSIPSG